jgi:hypothetical protein
VLRCAPHSPVILEHLPDPHGVDSEGRLRLEDAVRSAFRSARTPLSLEAMGERIRQRIDVSDDALTVLLSHAPFVQRNTDQYGLLTRDVPGAHDAIATALNAVVETLDQSQRVLSLSAAFELAREQAKQAWSIELVRSLIGSDPALCLSPSDDVRLRRWEHARLVAASELVCPGMPPSARPRFEKLSLAAPAHEELSRQLRNQLSRIERAADADDFFTLSLVRQLCDLYERLLDHVSSRSPESQRFASAAVCFFLEASSYDEDDLEGPGLDRDKLIEARGVLAAVLSQLELDWLAAER